MENDALFNNGQSSSPPASSWRDARLCRYANAAGRHIGHNKKKYIAAAVVGLIAIGLLATTFAIPQTRGAMHHMWSQVGHGFKVAGKAIAHGYTNKGGLGIGLRVGTTALGAGLLSVVAYAKSKSIKDGILSLKDKMPSCHKADFEDDSGSEDEA